MSWLTYLWQRYFPKLDETQAQAKKAEIEYREAKMRAELNKAIKLREARRGS